MIGNDGCKRVTGKATRGKNSLHAGLRRESRSTRRTTLLTIYMLDRCVLSVLVDALVAQSLLVLVKAVGSLSCSLIGLSKGSRSLSG
jgi:hypothetical protein